MSFRSRVMYKSTAVILLENENVLVHGFFFFLIFGVTLKIIYCSSMKETNTHTL